MSDFIQVYENVFDSAFCKKAIESMNKSFDLGFGFTRQDSNDSNRHTKDDFQVFPSQLVNVNSVFDDEMNKTFTDKFWSVCYKDYASKFSILDDLDQHTIHGNKLQKTQVGGGYHIWHCEHSSGESKRILAYIVYLNDVDEGGETEFLYQHKRYKPKQGSVVIFPAGFTHTHRGNPPLSNTKYIMTGWVEY